MRYHLLPIRILLLSVLIGVLYPAASVTAASRDRAQRRQHSAVRGEHQAEKRQGRAGRFSGKPVERERRPARDTRRGREQEVKAEGPQKPVPPVTDPGVAKSDGDRPHARIPAAPVPARSTPLRTAAPSGKQPLSRRSDQGRTRGPGRNPARVRTQRPQGRGFRHSRPEANDKETPREDAHSTPRRDGMGSADRSASRHPVITTGASHRRRRSATERHPVRPGRVGDRRTRLHRRVAQEATRHVNKKHRSGDSSGFRVGLHIGGDGFGVRLNYRDGRVIRHSSSFRYAKQHRPPRLAVVHSYGLGRYYRPHHRRYHSHLSHYGRYYSCWPYRIVFVYQPAPVIVEERVIVRAPTAVSVKPNDVYISTQNKLMDQVLHEDTEQRMAAARELSEYRNVSSVAVLIDVLVNDAEAGVRTEAADSLGRIGNPTAYEVLLRIAEADIDEHVRERAEHSARKIEEGIDAEVLHVSSVFPPMNQGDEQLGEYLEDLRFGSTLIRERAAAKLIEHRGTQAASALINVLINDYDRDVRLAAARSLSEMGDRMAVPFLELAAANDESPSVRKEAEEAVETITAGIQPGNTRR